MDILIIASMGLVIFVGLLSFLMNKYAEMWYQILVVNRLALINNLIITEEVPESWKIPFLDKAARQGTSSFWMKMQSILDAWYLYRLGVLTESIRTSSFINKEDKEEFLEALKQIRAEWAGQSNRKRE